MLSGSVSLSLEIRAVVSVVVLLLLSSTSAQPIVNDWLVVPGERVGPISASVSETEVKDLFGRENVEAIDVQFGEGFSEPGTAVFPNDPSRRIEILWADGDRSVPKEIRITGESSSWRTSEGLSLGSTLREIEQINGSPFRLAGFAFDYGGTIAGCGRGRLLMLGCDSTGSVTEERQIVLRLTPSADARALPEYRQVIGDRVFSSGHPAMQILNPSVYQMIVFIEHDPRSGIEQ
jgi:hypothetical protein